MTERDRTKNQHVAVDEPARVARHDPADDEAAALVARTGSRLIQCLFSASKTVQVHDLDNRATQRVLSDLMDPLSDLAQVEGRVQLRTSIDYLFVNDVRLTVDSQHAGPFLYLVEEMKARDVEAIEFEPGVEAAEVGRFLRIFFGETPDDDSFDRIEKELARTSITNIKLTQYVERERELSDDSDSKKDIREESNRVFFRTVNLMGEILRGIERKRVIQFRKAERLTQQMVDIIKADESILVGLASIKTFDEYTYAHSVNVCVLSMLMGDRLRLYKSDIARLGVAALLHDIGKTYVPQAILNNPGRLTDQDWELMKYHTFFGVKELTRIKAMREVSDALFVALQHHVHYNMDGYPQKAGGWKLRLFARIVTVADYFDAMTTPRVYQKKPLTPDRALRFILEKSGEIFDPFIAKVFIQAMGLYPIGTVVELDDGSRAVVVKQSDSGRYIHRPRVVLLDDRLRYGPDQEPVDLAAQHADGRYQRTIVAAIYDETAEVAKGDCFLRPAENQP